MLSINKASAVGQFEGDIMVKAIKARNSKLLYATCHMELHATPQKLTHERQDPVI